MGRCALSQGIPPARLRQVLGPVVATGLLHVALLAAYVAIFGGEISCLVCADRERVGRWPLEGVRVGFPKQGFDGQFYYVLARNPWKRHDAYIDLPAYRHARVLTPALGWLLSGGDPGRLLWALPAINVAALMGIGALGAVLALHHGRSGWWGCALPLVMNAGMPALRDLTDPVATLALVALLAGWLLRWPAWAVGLAGVAAVLGREQNVLIVGVVLLLAALARRWATASACLAALAVWGAWLATLRVVYGTWPFAPGNLSPPLAGMLSALRRGSAPHSAVVLYLLLQVGLCLAMLAYRAGPTPLLVGLAGAGLALCGGVGIYMNLESFTRVFLWMPLGLWLWGVESGRRWPVALLGPWALLPGGALLHTWHVVKAGHCLLF